MVNDIRVIQRICQIFISSYYALVSSVGSWDTVVIKTDKTHLMKLTLRSIIPHLIDTGFPLSIEGPPGSCRFVTPQHPNILGIWSISQQMIVK